MARNFTRLAFVFFWLTGTWVIAAPMPGTASSALAGGQPGLFYSNFGFTLHAGKSSWQLSSPPKSLRNIETLYKAERAKHGVQPALTVRVDQLKNKSSLKGYVKKWMKDYYRFGFDVLAAKTVKVGGQEGFLLDIINQDAAKQLRQVVFLRDMTAVILTCRDHKDGFQSSVEQCNEIIRTFRWL